MVAGEVDRSKPKAVKVELADIIEEIPGKSDIQGFEDWRNKIKQERQEKRQVA